MAICTFGVVGSGELCRRGDIFHHDEKGFGEGRHRAACQKERARRIHTRHSMDYIAVAAFAVASAHIARQRSMRGWSSEREAGGVRDAPVQALRNAHRALFTAFCKENCLATE